MVWTSILFIFAVSSNASPIFVLAVSRAWWIVWRVTFNCLAMLASCCPLVFRSHIIFCLGVKYPRLRVNFGQTSKAQLPYIVSISSELFISFPNQH